MNSWLEKIDIEMYSTHNEGTSAVSERYIRTLKEKIFKNHDFNVKKSLFW